MWQDLLAAVALLLIIEGIVPFLSPQGARRIYTIIAGLNDSKLRFAGLTGMLLGLLLLNLVK